jgi:iron(III) transport system permease protein
VGAGTVLMGVAVCALVFRAMVVTTGSGARVSFGNYIVLFGDPRIGAALANTLLAGIATTALSLLIGTTLAFLVTRTDLPGRHWLDAANAAPLFLSPFVGALSWLWLMAPHDGLLTTFAHDWFHTSIEWLAIYSVPGVIFVLTLFHIPLVYLPAASALRRIDAGFEDAARVHGASLGFTLRHVTLPLLAPALLFPALAVFVMSTGLLDVPLVLGASRGIPFIPTEVYAMTRSGSGVGEAAALGVLLLAVTIALTLGRRRFARIRRFDLTARDRQRPRTIRLRPAGRIAGLALEAAYLGGTLLAPFTALLLVASSASWDGAFHPSLLTSAHFRAIFGRAGHAIGDSLILAVTGATIGVALAALQGYQMARRDRRRDSFQDVAEAAMAWPIGVPALFAGLGMLALTVRTPLSGTLVIILLAWLARFPPLVSREVRASLQALDPDLEQSARLSGARWAETMRHVIVPLMRPTLLPAWLVLFAILLRELGATILLSTRGTETISVALVRLGRNSPGDAAALAVVQTILLLAVFLLFQVARATARRTPA